MSLTKRSDGSILIRDNGHYYDTMDVHATATKPFRGEVQMGYGLSTDPITGISSLGETIFHKTNEIVLGGTIFALEKLFNVSADLNVAYLNDILGFGLDGPTINEKYPKDTGLCLFNIGLGGCGAAYTDVKAILQQHRQLDTMIPFRVVDEPFTRGSEEAGKYYMMVKHSDGKFWYYGKTFTKTPIIKALWKDAGEDKDGSPVVESDYSSVKNTPIETFAEAVLTIETTDLREYFELYSEITHARFNSIGLCTGILSSCDDGRPEYKQVKQFSGLNFSNEPLHMNKDLSIIYRVYSA